MLIRVIKNSPIQIVVIVLILVMAVLNFVMIDELPFIVSRLQIEGKVQVSKPVPLHEDKAPDNLNDAAEDRMDRMRGARETQVYILQRNRRNDQGLDR